MKKIVIIVAAGNGSRMKNETPKQFLMLNHKPVLYYTINSFLTAFNDVEIILVLPEEHIAKGQEIIDGYFDNSKFRLCAGGRTRFHSVKSGISLIGGEEECIIFVHDGVRCLVTPELIKRCYESSLEFGTAIPAIACKDSIRIVEEDENSILSRDEIRMVQTPQTFHSKILLPAFKIDYKENFTDEATVVEAFGLKVHLIEGEEDNIKITTPLDLYVAGKVLEDRTSRLRPGCG